MGKKFLRVAFLLLLLMRSSANIEPNMKACIDNYELRFFCNLKYFNDAKKACQDEGSHMVKVDNANMTESINDVFDRMTCSNKKFHLGATATSSDSERVWKWLDGDKVYLRGEIGYNNWKDGQPNDFGNIEDCLRINEDNKQWVDSPCTGPNEDRPYICQKNLTLNTKINIMSDYASECSETSGSCVNQVNWRRNNEAVLSLQNHSVYQVFTSGSSVLHYQNATIRDEGQYSCVTWVLENRANQVSTSINIKVNGAPTINKIDLSTCNSSIIITWIPHPRALGFPHRVTIIDSNSKDQVRHILLTPTEDVEQVTEIKDLLSLTVYHIQITACINESICTNHSANATATSLGITVKNANLNQLVDNNTCIITWNWPYNISTDFKISLNSSLGFNTSKLHASVNKTNNEFSYSFEPYPEQVYKVQIQSDENSKLCSVPVRAVGSCIGEIRQTTVETTDQNTPKDEQTNFTTIIIPVVFVVVLLLLGVAFAVYKIRMRSAESDDKSRMSATIQTHDSSDYETVLDAEINATYSSIGDQPSSHAAVYVNYGQNKNVSYENVKPKQDQLYEIPTKKRPYDE